MDRGKATESLAKFISETEFEDLSNEVVHAAKRCLLDWVGVALAGSQHESVSILLDVLVNEGSSREAKIIGRDIKTDIFNSAFLNAFMAHIHDFDDTHLYTFLHSSPPLGSSIFALSNRVPINGKDALLAFVVGFEVATRIGMAIVPAMAERAWHMTGMVGGIGAATAIGKILRLNPEQQKYALAIAATHGSGLQAMLGSMSKSLHPGKAAQSGLFAALAAQRGFTSAENVFDAATGFFTFAAGKTGLDEVVLKGLGQSFQILRNSFKPYSCGVVTHPSIDGIIAIKDESSIAADEIDRIILEVNPHVEYATGKKEPQYGLEGKFSVYHCVAAAFFDGTCGPPQFADEKIRDAQISQLRKKVSINVNDSFLPAEAKITVHLTNGTTLQKYIPHASGTEHNPLSDEKLARKYEQNARMVLNDRATKELAELIWGLDKVADVNVIFQWVSAAG